MLERTRPCSAHPTEVATAGHTSMAKKRSLLCGGGVHVQHLAGNGEEGGHQKDHGAHELAVEVERKQEGQVTNRTQERKDLWEVWVASSGDL